MKITVLDAGTLGDDLSLSPLEKYGEVRVYRETKPEEVPARIADCDIAVLNKVRLGENNLPAAKNLKLICITATGFDNVDTAYCKQAGIGVVNVVGYSTDSVAQVTVSMVMSLATHLREYDAFVRDGRYAAGTSHNRLTPVYHELAGMTWGVVGYGNIGKKVADIAAAIGCKTLGFRAHPTGDEKIPMVGLDELFEKCDVISLHVPLNDGTRHLVGKDLLDKMKPGAILVNAARGAVVDEAAVADAVLRGKLGAFGSDVFDGEPMAKNSPFVALSGCDNVILTPHMAWGAYEARVRCLDDICLSIESFTAGGNRSRIV